MAEDYIDLKYVPKLNLFYDEERNVYLNESGHVVRQQTPTRRATDGIPQVKTGFSFSKMNFDTATVVQIIVLTTAAITQYYMMDSKIKDSGYELRALNTTVNNLNETVKEQQKTIGQLNAQVVMQSEILNALQIKVAAKNKN